MRLYKYIKNSKKSWCFIKSDTGINVIQDQLDKIDLVLIMSVFQDLVDKNLYH